MSHIIRSKFMNLLTPPLLLQSARKKCTIDFLFSCSANWTGILSIILAPTPFSNYERAEHKFGPVFWPHSNDIRNSCCRDKAFLILCRPEGQVDKNARWHLFSSYGGFPPEMMYMLKKYEINPTNIFTYIFWISSFLYGRNLFCNF